MGGPLGGISFVAERPFSVAAGAMPVFRPFSGSNVLLVYWAFSRPTTALLAASRKSP